MRTDRRGSVSVEALMALPVAIVMILLAQFILEASLSRQETAVFAREATVSRALDVRWRPTGCSFDGDDLTDRIDVGQTATARCALRDAEARLGNQKAVWKALDDGASSWRGILRDVKPRRGPRDVVGTVAGSVSSTGPQFLRQQSAVPSRQSYVAPSRDRFDHGTRRYARAHDDAIWDELCRSTTWKLFPNVFPNGGPARC
ncbi:hypothetical protein GQ651_17955 [Alphaproteobacteria bacterium GH1-50]|uniref:Uncharacterized protein n=1 Tax=Kangsaoukella pontilimi TaxID=2691042 RepID=A0A7C9MZ88_9RHOB|nr:hypothetical protein [Kangsaoukella pontilimi]MXQ09734.1 hypothetical protein [Kangsaoukella pontilimi]